MRPARVVVLILTFAGLDGARVHAVVEAVMAADGMLCIRATGITGTARAAPTTTPGCSVQRLPRGFPAEPIRKLYSDSDPGSGHHLGTRQGSSRPTPMFIDTDAVRVYRKK